MQVIYKDEVEGVDGRETDSMGPLLYGRRTSWRNWK